MAEAQTERTSYSLPAIRIWKKPIAITVAFVAVVFLALFHSFQVSSLTWVIGLGIGYVLQRGGLCFVASMRDPVVRQNTVILRAIVLALIVSTIGFALVAATRWPSLSHVHPVGIHTVLGGVAFGVGMVIAGACVSGALVRTGEGYVLQAMALLGILGGSLLGAAHFNFWYPRLMQNAPALFLPHMVGWAPALTIQLGFLSFLYWFLTRIDRNEDRGIAGLFRVSAFPKGRWSFGISAIFLGLLNVVLLIVQGKFWGITSELLNIAARSWEWLGGSVAGWQIFSYPEYSHLLVTPLYQNTNLFVALGAIVGAFLSSGSRMHFRLRMPRRGGQVAQCLIGGLLMGYASRLSFGCNIGALVSAIPSFSVHGIVFGVSMFAGTQLGIKVLLGKFLFPRA